MGFRFLIELLTYSIAPPDLLFWIGSVSFGLAATAAIRSRPAGVFLRFGRSLRLRSTRARPRTAVAVLPHGAGKARQEVPAAGN